MHNLFIKHPIPTKNNLGKLFYPHYLSTEYETNIHCNPKTCRHTVWTLNLFFCCKVISHLFYSTEAREKKTRQVTKTAILLNKKYSLRLELQWKMIEHAIQIVDECNEYARSSNKDQSFEKDHRSISHTIMIKCYKTQQQKTWPHRHSHRTNKTQIW